MFTNDLVSTDCCECYRASRRRVHSRGYCASRHGCTRHEISGIVMTLSYRVILARYCWFWRRGHALVLLFRGGWLRAALPRVVENTLHERHEGCGVFRVIKHHTNDTICRHGVRKGSVSLTWACELIPVRGAKFSTGSTVPSTSRIRT